MHDEPRHHVLLIGIDAYDGGALLSGCVNDIDAIQRVLIDRVKVDKRHIRRLAAPLDDRESDVESGEPTLANIRAALEALGGDEVGPQDRVFIYYSGHGTQLKVDGPNGVGHVREALLPTDYVGIPTNQYLFDWEFNALLARIVARTPAVTVVLDCCCAGGATREGLGPRGSRDRFWRITEHYRLPPGQEPPPRSTPRGLASGIVGAVSVCQVVAACLDDERARESQAGGGPAHGELTRALLKQLGSLPDEALAGLRWGGIWRALLADVALVNPAQTPWLSGGFARAVFGGPPEDGDVGYGVAQAGAIFRLDVGSHAGVTKGASVAVYGADGARLPELGSDEEKAARQGTLQVTTADFASAEAKAVPPYFELPKGARGRLVAAGESARIRVAVVPPDAAIVAALGQSPLLEVVGPGAPRDVALEQRADKAWALTDDVFGTGEAPGEPTLAVIPPARLACARRVVDHYYWYSAPLRLAKRCQDLPRCLAMRLLDCNRLGAISPADAQDPTKLPHEVPLGQGAAPYVFKGGDKTGGGDQVCLLVENMSDVGLYVTLIACQASGNVAVMSRSQVPGRGAHVFWQSDTLGRPFRLWLKSGQDVGVDRLVVIGTTNRKAWLKHLETKTRFAEIIQPPLGERNLGEEERSTLQPEVWTSTVTALRVER